MRAIISAAVGAAALSFSCGPDLSDPQDATGADSQALSTEPMGGQTTGRQQTPARVEWVAPGDVRVEANRQSFQDHYAYTVCALGTCK